MILPFGIYKFIYKIFSPLAFKDEKLEKKFVKFFYGKNLIRMQLLFIAATIFWAVVIYSDFTDYKHVSTGLRITNFCLRGLGLLMIGSSLVLIIPPLRRNHYIVEFFAIVVGIALIGLTGIKHAFKNDTTQLPTVIQLVGWAFLAGLGCRFHTLVIPSIFSWIGYTATMIAVDYNIAKTAFFYVSISFVFISYCAFIFQSFSREREFRILFLARQKLKKATKKVKKENERSSILLKNIFPRHFVEDDTLRGSRFVQSYDDLVILVHDLVSFTAYATKTPGEVLIKQLNKQFSLFESLATSLNLEKLKSAGDSLTLFALDGKPGASRCVYMGNEMIKNLQELNKLDETSFSMRVGIAIGKGFLAVMGNDQLEFDGFGNVMMYAEEMEQTSQVNRVHVTKEIYNICNDLYDFESLSQTPDNELEDSYLLVRPLLGNDKMIEYFKDEYQKRLLENGLSEDGVYDGYVDRYTIKADIQSSQLNIFSMKSNDTNLSNLSNLANEENSIRDILLQDDNISYASSKDVEMNLTLKEYRKLYQPNQITTLFNKLNVNKHFLSSSYKKRLNTMRFTFIMILIMLFTHLISLTVMYPKLIDSHTQAVRYTLITIATVWVAIFIIIPPLSRIPLMGTFTSISLTLIMTVYLYTLMFEEREIFSKLGDQGLIYLAWTTYASFAIPWVLKTIIFFFCCVLYLIFFSIFGKLFSTLIFIFCAMSLLNVLVFHRVHFAIAKSFSNYRILKKELQLLKKEEEMNNNLMRSVVPDKLVSHLKSWVEKHFDVMSKFNKNESSKKGLINNRISQDLTQDKIIKEDIYIDLHTSSFIENGTSLFFYLTNYNNLISSSKNSIQLITMLHELFSFFDSIVNHLGCSKVKWKGCTYIAIAGSDGKKDHTNSLLKAATYMLDIGRRFFQGAEFENVHIKIGLDTGAFHEALLGTSKFRQDYFSDTLNTSSRMASTAKPDTIQITERVYELIKDKFKTQYNGEVEIKGKGKMVTYTVL